ncbi:MAG: porin OmpL1 [Leptospiraceae bacterium]|nr:porin OmpL1 [Leptospiraceae bacterium]
MKKLVAFLVSALFLGTGSVYAEGSYLGIGVGLQFDLASLGDTITNSGLDSAQNSRAVTSATKGAIGCDQPSSSLSATQIAACKAAGGAQELIVPENKLIALEKGSGMAIRAHTGSAMTGLVLNLFYEQQMDGTFMRGGVEYVKRIAGGRTRATLFEGSPIETEWLKHEWDYYAWHIPLYYGVNIAVGDSGSVYAGAGINYSEGGWNLGGTVLGDIPAGLLGTFAGPHSSLAYDAVTGNITGIAGQNVYKEAAKFRVKGLGFNYVIGVDKKMAGGDKLFFELETIVAGKHGTSVTTSAGGRAGLGGVTAYPINLSGTRYKFGYKIAM